MEYFCVVKMNEHSRFRKDSSMKVVPGTFEAHNRNCSHLVKAGNDDVIIVDPPNGGLQKLTGPHTTVHFLACDQ
jgi:hypothetical protein